MKSEKPVLPLTDILRPFLITPKRFVSCEVNSVKYSYPANVTSPMSKQAYEALLFTEFNDELVN